MSKLRLDSFITTKIKMLNIPTSKPEVRKLMIKANRTSFSNAVFEITE